MYVWWHAGLNGVYIFIRIEILNGIALTFATGLIKALLSLTVLKLSNHE